MSRPSACSFWYWIDVGNVWTEGGNHPMFVNVTWSYWCLCPEIVLSLLNWDKAALDHEPFWLHLKFPQCASSSRHLWWISFNVPILQVIQKLRIMIRCGVVAVSLMGTGNHSVVIKSINSALLFWCRICSSSLYGTPNAASASPPPSGNAFVNSAKEDLEWWCSRADGRSVCQSLGMKLAELIMPTLSHQLTTAFVCSGPLSTSWINAWNGQTWQTRRASDWLFHCLSWWIN